jgi:hypothetical protein
MEVRRRYAHIAVGAALGVVLLFASASLAFALPVGEQTLGLVALQQKLADSPTHTLPGYMKTVVQGATIETIPVEVESLTGDTLAGSFIMFEATGTQIAHYGGIVAGMSGSPIYVSDDGIDKVIGAVSYGQEFTIGGTGLATPIEFMLALIDDYAPHTVPLSTPVLADGKVLSSVIISSHPQDYRAAAAAGAFVAKPLSEAFIGGLRTTSTGYKKLADALSKKGMSVVTYGAGASAGASNFATDLAPGAGVGVLATRGDMWVGGIGTVTYADGDNVLAFGHSEDWSGITSLYMTNVWITGVWPSLLEPTKMGYPTAIRGTITQDRYFGVMGELGDRPAEIPVTAEVTDADTSHTATSSVWMSSKLMDNGSLSGAVGSALSVAGYKLYDTATIPGSASTTATVVVSNGDHEYTIVIPNVYDDGYDVVYYATADAQNAVTSLLSVLSDGIEAPHIVSVDLQASYSSHRNNAEIVDVNLLEPIHEGDNTVRVSMLAYGIVATQTVDATITVPEGTPLTGDLVASSAYGSYEDSSTDYTSYDTGEPVSSARETVSSIVDELNATEKNDVVDIAFVPASDSGDSGDSSGLALSSNATVTVDTSATAPFVLDGQTTTAITEIDAKASTATYGNRTWVAGEVTGPTGPVVVKIYGLMSDGPTTTLLATGTATWNSDGILAFNIPVSGLTGFTELEAAVDAGMGYTPADTSVFAEIRARVALTGSPKTMKVGKWATFKATVSPWTTGSVKFQYYDAHHKKWRALITKRLSSALRPLGLLARQTTATCKWRAHRGTWKVRAVFGGSNLDGLLSGISNTVTVKVH